MTTHLDATSGAVTPHLVDLGQSLLRSAALPRRRRLHRAPPRRRLSARHQLRPRRARQRRVLLAGDQGRHRQQQHLHAPRRRRPIAGDPTYGYLALFATESTTGTDGLVTGSRELAVVRVRRELRASRQTAACTLDPALPDTLDVMSGWPAAAKSAALAHPLPGRGRRPVARRAPQARAARRRHATWCCGSAGAAPGRNSPGRGAW